MPRVSRRQADLNREAIKLAAARLYRERGFDGVGIPEITRAAGLTHGSFYGHFESKEALAAEALAAGLDIGMQRWETRAAQGGREGLIRGYLATRNRDTPGDACPIAALAGDMARQPADAPTRPVFNMAIGMLLKKLAAVQAVQPDAPAGIDEQKALADLSAMVGALIMSRATIGSDVSDKFLSLVSAELIAKA